MSECLFYSTDLDWNSVRYLQHCEGIRPDVTLLSLQLMPFPWFIGQQVVCLDPSVFVIYYRDDCIQIFNSLNRLMEYLIFRLIFIIFVRFLLISQPKEMLN